jgi:hypothetical protein
MDEFQQRMRDVARAQAQMEREKAEALKREKGTETAPAQEPEAV